jgi:hypothetical protein
VKTAGLSVRCLWQHAVERRRRRFDSSQNDIALAVIACIKIWAADRRYFTVNENTFGYSLPIGGHSSAGRAPVSHTGDASSTLAGSISDRGMSSGTQDTRTVQAAAIFTGRGRHWGLTCLASRFRRDHSPHGPPNMRSSLNDHFLRSGSFSLPS